MKLLKSTLGVLCFISLAVLLVALNSPAATNYLQWLGQYGLPLDSSGLGAFTAAPATDSIPNLIKFSLGLNPLQAGYAGRYGGGISNNAGQNYLAITYVSPYPAPNGIAINGEFSSNVITWPGVVGTQIGNATNGGLQTITLRDAAPVAGATARFARLKVVVTATVPTNTVAPQVTGTASVGQTLTAVPGTWDGGSDSPPAYTYQWIRNGTNIAGATNATYLYTTNDVGGSLAVNITARNIAGAAAMTVTNSPAFVTNTVQYQVAASADDTWCAAGAGNSIYNDTQMYAPYTDTSRLAFVRWALTVPPGATILSADLQLKAYSTDVSGSAGTVQIAVVSSNSCPDFATYNPYAFGTLAGTTNWTIPSTWTINTWYSSGTNSLTALVQAFINQGGYASGNYMGLRLANASGTYKQAYQWDYGTHTNGAILRVSYSTNLPPSAPTAGNNGPVCAGSTLNLTASTVAGATYSWTGPNGFTSSLQNPAIANATTAASGTYSVTATVGGQILSPGTTTATVNAIPSAPTAGDNGPITSGATLNLTASTVSNASYSWTGPNGFTSSAQNPSIVNAMASDSGTYYVTATVSGCASSAGSTTATVNGGGVGSTNRVTMVVASSGSDAASLAGAGNAGDLADLIYWPYTDNTRLGYMRWQSQIPPGATITAAYLKVQANGQVGNVDKSVVKVQVMNTNNCAAFSSAFNPFGAAMMSGYVNWTNNVSFVAPTGWTNGAWYTSPDLSSLIQAYINRSDYTFGNYIGIGGSYTAGTWKGINTWDAGDHSGAPQLVVYYTGGQTMLSLWMADPEVRLAQKVYCQLGNTYATDTLQVKLDGNVIYTKVSPLSSTQEVFTANYRSLAAGAHTLQVNVLQTNGAVRTTASRTWTKLHNGIGKVGIDENNAICVNGTPFFPITPWGIDAGTNEDWMFGPPSHVDSLFGSWNGDINTLCGQSFDINRDSTNWAFYLNQAATAGLPAMGPAIGNYYPSGKIQRTIEQPVGSGNYVTFNQLDTNRIAQYITASKDNPALMAWIWQDEPDLGGPNVSMPGTELRRWTDLCHRMDTEHPHYVNLVGYPFSGPGPHPTYNNLQQQGYSFLYDDQYNATWGTNKAFATKTPVCDIISFDYYPYDLATYPSYSSWIGLADLALALDNMRDWNYNLLPTMTWIETCDINVYPSYPTPAPTAAQLNNMIWLSIIHGVKGISWFHYFQPTPAENWVVMSNAVKWIGALTQPILSAPENVTNVISGQGPTGGRVDLMSRQYNGGLYIFATTIPTSGIATNGMGTNVAFTVSGLAAGQQIGVLGEGRTITSAAGSFTDAFSPLAVHIYTYPALANIPPVANAGINQQLRVANTNALAAVTLKGANSFDMDGTIMSYVWKEGAAQITTGATAAVNLPFGTHAISLVVTDNGGATGTNTVIVNVTL